MSFNNKRRRDDEDDGELDRPLHHQRSHFVKKPRQELSQELQLAIKLCEDITKLGEKNLTSFSNDINYMSFPISEEIEASEEIRNAVLKTVYAVIIEQPHKQQFVGALLHICNLRNPLVAKYVFEFLHQKSQELINDIGENWLNKLKLIFRFFAINRKLVLNDGVVKIFEQFLNVALDLQKNSDQRVGIAELIYYNVLITIPYLKFYGESESNIGKLIKLAEEFKIVTIKSSSMYEHFDNSTVKFAKPYDTKYLIDLILPSLQQGSVETPFINVESLLQPILDGELHDKELQQHALPQFAISLEEGLLQGNIDSLWNNPRVLLEVYLSQTNEFETKPPVSSYFGLLLNDICQDIIQNMEFNKNSVSQQLLILDSFFVDKIFAKPGSSIDKLTILNDKNNGTILEIDMEDPSSAKIAKIIEEVDLDYDEGYISTWKIEDTLTEAILNLIFNLPNVSNPIIFFYTVLVECCSKESKAMAPVFGRAIRFFFANITILDFELRSRYLDWLAVQLSNFRFQWKWHEWTEYVLKNGDLNFNPIMIFIKNLIAKEIRLSSVKKIQDTLPQDFYKYLDISLNDKEYIVNYDTELFGKYWETKDVLDLKFTDEENIQRDQCVKIFTLLQEDLNLEILKELSQDLDDRYVINLIVQSSCIIGSRSISHVKFFIEKNHQIIETFIASLKSETSLKEKWIIESVLRVWNHEPQIGYLVLEMLLMNKMISGETYLTNLFENNYAVLLNISAVESLLRVLTNLELYNISNSIFQDLILLIQSSLDKVITKLGNPDLVQIQEDELNDTKWCYVELLRLLKSILRKFSHEYQKQDSIINIEHQQTKGIIIGYLQDLRQMK